MMKTIKLGAQINTIRDHIKTIDDFKISMSKVKNIGYSAVQLDLHHITPGIQHNYEHIYEILNNVGLLVTNTHIQWYDIKKNIERAIEINKILNSKHSAIPLMPIEYKNKGELGYLEFARETVSFSKKFLENGISLSYHNHSFEFERFGSKTGLDIIFDYVGKDSLQAEIDTYWIQHGGSDPSYWVEKMKDNSPVIHFKDMIITNEGEQVFAEIGQGNLNWEKIIDATKNSKIEWIVVEQDFCQSDPFDCLKTSYHFLNKYGFY
tara:strand:- start:126 stop:917 length:792 start_codon:yes stop_codon:yes gene_type:complete